MGILPVNMTNPRKIGQIAQIFAEGQIRNQELQVNLLKQKQEREAINQTAKAFQDEMITANDPNQVFGILGKTGVGLLNYGDKGKQLFNMFGDIAKAKVESLKQTKNDFINTTTESIVGNKKVKTINYFNKNDFANPNAKPIRTIVSEEPYISDVDKTKQETEKTVAKDVEDYRSKYNEANATVTQLEDVYGKQNLMKWGQDAIVKENIAKYGDDAESLKAAILAGDISPEEANRVKAVSWYTKSVSAKKAQSLNLSGKGFTVDDSGNLIKPPIKAKTGGTEIKKAPKEAIDYLKANNTPEMREAFKVKYGYLP
jgi:hypothetical protein